MRSRRDIRLPFRISFCLFKTSENKIPKSFIFEYRVVKSLTRGRILPNNADFSDACVHCKANSSGRNNPSSAVLQALICQRFGCIGNVSSANVGNAQKRYISTVVVGIICRWGTTRASLLNKFSQLTLFPSGYPNWTTPSWEQRKLGELYSLVSEKNDLTFGRESIISVANMYFNANINVADEQYLRTYNVMRLGDIAFEGHSNKEFSHGRFVENYIGDGIVSHIFTVLRPRVPFDVNYWRYAINNEKIMRLSLIRSTKASTMMHDLVPSDFLREAIPTPTLAEQKEIGAFLVGLDHLITLHQREPRFADTG